MLQEVSSDVWGTLVSMKSLCGEPVSMWLPEHYKKPGTSTYVQGVEVEPDYTGIVPEGFDTIRLHSPLYSFFPLGVDHLTHICVDIPGSQPLDPGVFVWR